MAPDEDFVRRPTTAFVNVDALTHNVRAVREHVASGTRLMAVVKANAYGHGLIPTAKVFLQAGVHHLGVAFLEEGIQLRDAGIRAPILVLGGLIGNQVRHFLEYDLELTAASPYKIEQIEQAAARLGTRARVHLKVDTGMERIGVQWTGADKLLRAAERAAHVDVVGTFSHFAEAERPGSEFTKEQVRRFRESVVPGPQVGLRHLANSGGLLFYPESHLDLVRPGLALYGVAPGATELSLRPALSLSTRVVYFKVVRAGTTVSYDRTWAPEQDTRVVTLPVGYGDGYMRALSNRAQVLIRGRRYPVVGRVTMDATMVDLGPEGTAYNGDEVVLIGGSNPSIHVTEVAAWAGTIPYEVLTAISARVPR
ncbi:MAG: alanine racemase, partial [Myxococcota bacterium]